MPRAISLSRNATGKAVGARALAVFGTRPEAIKMAPVVRALRGTAAFEVKVCVTGQHREMLDQALAVFSLRPDFDLNVMAPNQTLADLTATVLCAMSQLYVQWRPDVVLVHGDTSTTFAASLAAWYAGIPVAHVEAGLRTRRKHSPWPEEGNRCLTAVLASWHYAPTEAARDNLLREGVDPGTIIVTGNTVVDAITDIVTRFNDVPALEARYDAQFSLLDARRRLVLVTGHRRENFGERLRRICIALRELAQRDDIEVVYPVHLNPNVRQPVREILGEQRNIRLIEPQDYMAFVYLLKRCYMVLSDSGGIQEEAPLLGKPVLLLRHTTERQEAVDGGGVRVVGTGVARIVREASRLLDNAGAYRAMARPMRPFGDGNAARRIADHLSSIRRQSRRAASRPASPRT